MKAKEANVVNEKQAWIEAYARGVNDGVARASDILDTELVQALSGVEKAAVALAVAKLRAAPDYTTDEAEIYDEREQG